MTSFKEMPSNIAFFSESDFFSCRFISISRDKKVDDIMESVPPNFGRMAYAIRSCSDANLLSWPSANNNSAFIVCCIALLAKDTAALLVLIDAMVGTTLTELASQNIDVRLSIFL